jgi:hypothetical protein
VSSKESAFRLAVSSKESAFRLAVSVKESDSGQFRYVITPSSNNLCLQ